MLKKILLGLVAVGTCFFWYLLIREKDAPMNPFGKKDAEGIGEAYGEKRSDWRQFTVKASGAQGGHWHVLVSRDPPVPGAHFTLELDQDGKVLATIPGK